MKANDYLIGYLHGTRIEDIAKSFVDETADLIKSRSIERLSALASIVDEIDSKWKSLCRKLEEYKKAHPEENIVSLNPEGYKILVEKVLPEVHKEYQRYKMHTKIEMWKNKDKDMLKRRRTL